MKNSSGGKYFIPLLIILGILVVMLCAVIVFIIAGKDDKSSLNHGDSRELIDRASHLSRDEASVYGPFSSREEMVHFIQDYYEFCDYQTGENIAPLITTDYGTEKEFTRKEFIERGEKHDAKYHIIRVTHDIDKNSVKSYLIPDGGIKVTFDQIYEMTCLKDSREYTRKFSCETEFDINRDKEIYYIWERSKKIDEWWN